MFKKIFFLSFLLTLTNCAAPGTALLGPAFTGATTKSAARTSVSIASSTIVKKVENIRSYKSIASTKIVQKLENFRSYQQNKNQ